MTRARRTPIGIVAMAGFLLVAGCTTRAADTNEQVVETAATVAPTSTTSSSATEPIDDDLRRFEPITDDDDPFGIRRARPTLRDAPVELWRIEIGRNTIIDLPVGVGETVAYVARDRLEDPKLIGRDRTTGEEIWTFAVEDTIVGATRIVGDVLIVEWLPNAHIKVVTAIDPSTGEELWRIDYSEERFVASYTPHHVETTEETYGLTFDAIDPRTAEPAGRYSSRFSGSRGPLHLERNVVAELHPQTLEKQGDPLIIDRAVDDVDSLVMVRDGIVVSDDGKILAYDRNGNRVGSHLRLQSQTPELFGVSAASNMFIVSYPGYTAAFDLTGSEAAWEREVAFEHFGMIDGEMHAVTIHEHRDALGVLASTETELFSLVTGVARCMIPETVTIARDGFYGASTAYDVDCTPMWTLPTAPEHRQQLVGNGVVRWKSSVAYGPKEIVFYG